MAWGKLKTRVLRPSAEPPAIHFGLFGKHPGWTDHIRDENKQAYGLGLETQHLQELFRFLYNDGIKPLIPAWQKLSETERLPGFDHLFLWFLKDAVVVGCLWSSRDSAGRTDFPMVLAADCRGVSREWVLDRLVPRIESIRQQCTQTDSAADIQKLLERVRAEMTALASGAGNDPSDHADKPPPLAPLINHPQWESDKKGLKLVLHRLESDVVPRLNLSKTRVSAAHSAELMRLPTLGLPTATAVASWMDFICAYLGASPEMFVLAPRGESWIDVIIGPASVHELICLRATTVHIPLITQLQVPAGNAAEAEKADEFLRAVAAEINAAPGETGPAVMLKAKAQVHEPRAGKRFQSLASLYTSKKQVFLIGLAALIALLCLIILPMFLIRSCGESPPASSTTGTSSSRGVSTQEVAENPDWASLCKIQYDWFARFVEELTPEKRSAFGRNPRLKEVLGELDNAARDGVELNPGRIINDPSASLKSLGQSPPASARTPEAAAKSRKALAVIRSIEAKLGPGSWELLDSTKAASADFAKREWPKPAEAVSAVTDQVYPTTPIGFVAAIDQLLTTGPVVKSISRGAQELDAQSKKLQTLGDPMLARFAPMVAAHTRRAQDIESLQRAVDSSLGQAKQLAAAWDQLNGPGFDRQQFEENEKNQPPPAEPTPSDFRAWQVRSRLYARLTPDPRGKPEEWNERFAKTRKDLKVLEGLKGLAGQPPGSEAAVSGAQAASEPLKALDALQEQNKKLWALTAIARDEEKITSQLNSMAEGLDKLTKNIQSQIVKRTVDPTWLEKVKTRQSITSSAVLDESWRQRRDAKLGDATADKLTKNPALFTQLKGDVDRIEFDILIIDDPKEYPPANQLPCERSWQKEAVKLVAKNREEAMRASLDQPGKRADLAAGYRAAYASAERVLNALAIVEDGVDQCFTWNDKPVAQGQTLGEVFDSAQKEAAFERLSPACKAISQQAEELRRVSQTALASDLAKAAADTKADTPKVLAVRWAIWMKLGQEPSWPGKLSELESERDIGSKLESGIKSESENKLSEARRGELIKTFKEQRSTRWQRGFLALSSMKDLGEAQKRMSDFGLNGAWQNIVAFEPKAAATVVRDPRVRWNLLLLALQAKISSIRVQDDEQVRKVIGAFKEGLAADPDMTQLPAHATLMKGLENLGNKPPGGGEGLRQIGLAKALGWTEADDKAGTVTYASPKDAKVRLQFRRFETNGKPFYLATTTISVAVFNQIMADAGADAWTEIRPWLLHPWQDDYGRVDANGPYVWILKDKPQTIIKTATKWWDAAPAWRNNGGYAPGVEIPPPPKDQHPFQRISPRAALYLAFLSGCRLPTSQEWKQVYTTTHADKEPPSAWNLRDATWKKQWDYAASGSGAAPTPQYSTFPSGQSGKPPIKASEDGNLINSDDDHALWFLEVDKTANGREPIGGMYHLVGNVAQYVLDASLSDSSVGSPRARVEKLLPPDRPDHSGMVKVIGGSALSSPAVWADKQFDQAKAVDLATSVSGSGFSDVGVRFAFDAPTDSLAAQTLKLLNDSAFILRK